MFELNIIFSPIYAYVVALAIVVFILREDRYSRQVYMTIFGIGICQTIVFFALSMVYDYLEYMGSMIYIIGIFDSLICTIVAGIVLTVRVNWVKERKKYLCKSKYMYCIISIVPTMSMIIIFWLFY